MTHLNISNTSVSVSNFVQFPLNLEQLDTKDCPRVKEAALQLIPGKLGAQHIRARLNKIPQTKGFIWEISKPGKPPHFLAGICHPVFEQMNQNSAFLRALHSSRTIFTESIHLASDDNTYEAQAKNDGIRYGS